ncbi:PREDICTED: inactive phospholipase C-like protein 2 [Priapulus caudatus]|uniref:Phosphoinositide phospholipase C n=1 Tax=Priapulus caudatus TaxID=37621 RepID=A0ABM1DQ49_PRICU|nr:PREDICTED: inactive phospholipase C-like protein 2 [Priapulus caudatus]
MSGDDGYFPRLLNHSASDGPSDCLHYMQTGCDLVKVRSTSRQYHRYFMLDEDMSALRWHPTSKKPNKAKIPVGERQGAFGAGMNTTCFRPHGAEQSECQPRWEWIPVPILLSSSFLNSRCAAAITWLSKVFTAVTSRTDGSYLDEQEVVELVQKLNPSISNNRIRLKFKEIEQSKPPDEEKGRLSSKEFADLYKEISTRPEIYFLLVRYASNDFMTVDDLMLFLEAEQGMKAVTKEKCRLLIEQYEPSRDGREKGHLGIDGFTSYLLSDECDVFEPAHRVVCQDMTHPLPHYFVATSHNTFLLEDQLKGPAGVEGFIRALQSGCRCVEMHCWDGADGDPVVFHGHTLTSMISFKAVIESINEFAFCVSE